jgi:hypothetical protein
LGSSPLQQGPVAQPGIVEGSTRFLTIFPFLPAITVGPSGRLESWPHLLDEIFEKMRMVMKVTVFELRDAIKMWELRRELPEKQFSGSLKAYPSEKDPVSPANLAEEYSTAEDALAVLQTAQMRYNLAVPVTVDGKPMSLAEAIKRVGGMGRLQKMWKSAIKEKDTSYMPDSRTIGDGTEYMVATIEPKAAMGRALQAGRKHSGLQAVIGMANSTSIEIENLDPALFE